MDDSFNRQPASNIQGFTSQLRAILAMTWGLSKNWLQLALPDSSLRPRFIRVADMQINEPWAPEQNSLWNQSQFRWSILVQQTHQIHFNLRCFLADSNLKSRPKFSADWAKPTYAQGGQRLNDWRHNPRGHPLEMFPSVLPKSFSFTIALQGKPTGTAKITYAIQEPPPGGRLSDATFVNACLFFNKQSRISSVPNTF